MKAQTRLMKLNLSKRILLGYIIMIFIPIIVLTLLFFLNFYKNATQDYAASKQLLLNDSCTNLEISITQIERIYESLQYNKNLQEYLSGYYTDKDAVYNLLKYIRPVLSNLALSNPYISGICIYKTEEEIVSMSPEIQNLSSLPNGKEQLQTLAFNGQWVVRQDEEGSNIILDYQKTLFSDGYTRQVALLDITTDAEMMDNFLNGIQAIMQGDDILLLYNNELFYQRGTMYDTLSDQDRQLLLQSENDDAKQLLFLPSINSYVNGAAISQLNMRLVVIGSNQGISENFSKRLTSFFLLTIALLVLVFVFYFYLGISVSTRITRLLKHMRTVGESNMRPFTDRSVFNDEISLLASTFNQMINRIADLINTANRTELLRKEAEYSALQAQIQPHFFYNTIEAIRLMAEDHEDFDTADACYALGCLMRYSLSNKQPVITLDDELRNAEYYLSMYKLRMGYKFEYKINVQSDLKSMACPKYILQPLIENSIVHGVSKSNPKGCITLNIKYSAPHVIISIHDNGVGMSAQRIKEVRQALNQPKAKDCFGVANVNNRIHAFYGHDSGIDFTSKIGQYTLCTMLLYIDKREKKQNTTDILKTDQTSSL